ncbi:MAG: hypothetical protein AAFW70_11315 [Cyanobacteria bacterium J06635_10]
MRKVKYFILSLFSDRRHKSEQLYQLRSEGHQEKVTEVELSKFFREEGRLKSFEDSVVAEYVTTLKHELYCWQHVERLNKQIKEQARVFNYKDYYRSQGWQGLSTKEIQRHLKFRDNNDPCLIELILVTNSSGLASYVKQFKHKSVLFQSKGEEIQEIIRLSEELDRNNNLHLQPATQNSLSQYQLTEKQTPDLLGHLAAVWLYNKALKGFSGFQRTGVMYAQ